MKKFNKSMTSLAIATSMAALASTPVFAATNPKEVITQINQGNWNQAETLIQQVLREQPGSAKAWYYRAQIETQLAKNSPYHSNQELSYIQSALASLNKAKSLDNTLSFAQNPAKVAQLESQLKGAEATVKTAQAAMQQNVSKTNTAVVHQPSVAVAPKTENHSSGGMGGFAFVLLAIGAASAAGYFFIKRKDKNALKDELNTIKTGMVTLTDDIKSYMTDLEFQGKETSLQFNQANSLWDEITTEIPDVSNVERIPAYRNRLDTYQSRFKQIKNGSFNVVKQAQLEKEQAEYAESRRQAEKVQAVPRAKATSPSRVNSDFSRPASSSRRNEYDDEQERRAEERREREREEEYRRNNSYHNQQPHTTIINNGNQGSGFGDVLTGVAIGSILSNAGHHDKTTIIEREVPQHSSPSNSDFDQGNGGNSWSNPPSGNGGFDFGSNDNDSFSSPKNDSFDFGNNFDSNSDFTGGGGFDAGQDDDQW